MVAAAFFAFIVATTDNSATVDIGIFFNRYSSARLALMKKKLSILPHLDYRYHYVCSYIHCAASKIACISTSNTV